MEQLYEKVIEIFEKDTPPGHDYKHALRTAELAKKIALAEGYDPTEAEAAGLLHDVGRTLQEEDQGHGPAGVPLAKDLLDRYTQFTGESKQRILTAISVHSDLRTEGALEQILQDADKLDGMGAIGISRAYLSKPTLTDYDLDNIIPEPGDYNQPTSIHQQIRYQMTWYDMLYTETAKQLGKERYEFMQHYLEQVKKETEETK